MPPYRANLTGCPRPVNAAPRMAEHPDIAAMSFEDALRALEDVVRRLESGETPLEESIDLYSRGDALRAHCQARLTTYPRHDA